MDTRCPSPSAPLDPLRSPASLLAELAPMSARSWHALGAQLFAGELSLTTDDAVFRFKNGVFLSWAQKPARSFDCPESMQALRLVGFLKEEGALFSLSVRWREGAHAVLARPGDAEEPFVVTPPTREFTLEEPDPKPDPEPKPTPWVAPPAHSGGVPRFAARPPTVQRPLPPSTTRIHSAPPAPCRAELPGF